MTERAPEESKTPGRRGHSAILLWPREEFDAVVARLNDAFVKGAASLYFDVEFSAHLIDIFDRQAAGLSEEEYQQLGPVVPHFEQIMTFAYESAPASVITEWAEEHEVNTGPEAVSRVEHFRRATPAIRREWRARTTSAGYVFGNVDADVLINPISERLQAQIRMDSFIPGPGPRRAPVGSSRQWFTVAMTANEIGRLISSLERYKDLITQSDEADDEEISSPNGAETANNSSEEAQ